MARGLTTKGVEAHKPDPDRRVEISDPGQRGLYLVVQPSGAKSWAARFRHAGKPVKLTLGRWPMMGLAEARAAAAEAIEKVERGANPAAEKAAAKAAAQDAAASGRDKVKTLFEQFHRRHLASLKSGALIRRELDRHVIAAWGERDIHEISKRDVIDLLDGIADSGRIVTANRVRAYLNKFLNWCVERDVLATNPAGSVKAVAKEASRDRVLTDDEIRWFWAACEASGQPWGPFGKLLLLTGQRLNEVAQMTQSELRGDLWQMNGSRTKSARAHDVPLSDAVRAVLDDVPMIAGPQGFIFTTTGRTAVSGFHKARATLAEAMEQIAAKERGEAVEILHWTFHDLRRTCATGLARLGIPVRVTEAVLNHVSGTGGGLVAVYQRHDYADEKRQALAAWARYVTDLVDGRPSNVVQLSAAGGGR
jgi:integrase